ncbi:DUF4157 domain-containing protein [Streptomyces sp. CA-249302]|uniref:eCIS core domain-containing protein n=1 Tax=Streptomyces sp. CA-249302 TaxID=3240058 RepID=UPI003D8C3DDC
MHAKELPEKNTGAHRPPAPSPLVAGVAEAAAGTHSPQAVAALQRTAGNAAVTRMIELQRERAAGEEHRHGAGCGHEPTVQRRVADDVGSLVRSGGSRMDASLQREMEGRFGGEDFSDVSLHTGTAARASSEAVGAEAYTTHTNHIVFRGTVDKKTLAHELEHVRQQRAGAVAGTDDGSGVRISDPSDHFEQSAERVADQVMSGGAAVQRSVATGADGEPGTIQRMKEKTARKGKKAAAAQEPEAEPVAEKSEQEKIVDFFDALDEGFKAKPPNEKELILENLGIGTAYKTLDAVLEDEDLPGAFREELGNAEHEPGFQTAGEGNGRSSKWAAGAVTSAHAKLRIAYPHWGDRTTLHHKISRSELDRIMAAAERDGPQAAPLFVFLDRIRAVLASTAEDVKALHNMPANLEMGPASDTRTGDPGSGTDFNIESGAMTPRSSALNDALSLAGQPTVDWQAVADKLAQAQRIQEKEHGGAIISAPVLARWKQRGPKWEKQDT